jgi:hypothetical protein
MNQKLYAILVCMLLIATCISVSGYIEKEKSNCKFDISIYPLEESNNENINNYDKNKLNPISIAITKPKNYLYLNDVELFPFFIPVCIGPITITAQVTSDTSKGRVEFSVDGELKYIDYSAPYNWFWDETTFFSREVTVNYCSDDYASLAFDSINIFTFNYQPKPKMLSKQEAVKLLVDEIIKPATLNHTLYAFTLDAPLKRGNKVAPWLPEPVPANVEKFPYLIYRNIERLEWFFWIDDVPRALYSHDTRFVFIDAKTGAIHLNEERWWPVLNGISLWTSPTEYWNPNNWAYTNDQNPFYLDPFEDNLEKRYSRAQSPDINLGSEGAIVINGWSKGQSCGPDINNTADKIGRFFITYPGFDTKTVNPPNNNQSSINDAFNYTSDNEDVVVYIVGHGGVDAAGEPYASCGGDKVTEDELCKMAKDNPNTTYKWVIECCHSGSFIKSLSELNNSAKIITASDKCENAYADIDPANDPNKNDTGTEFGSGFYEDLWEEWLKNPLIDVIDLLDLAYKSAVAKDAGAINGWTHPQVWERKDKDAPIVVITEPENNSIIFSPVVKVRGWAIDTVSGIVLLDYLWESTAGDFYGYSTIDPPSPYIYFQLTLDEPVEGWNKVTIGAKDSVGNYGTDYIRFYWETQEDNTPPVTTKEVGKPKADALGYYLTPFTPIWLNATDPQPGSGVEYIHFEIWWDSDGDEVIDTLMAFENVYDDTVELYFSQYGIMSGLVELRWRATDNAENSEEMHFQLHDVLTEIPIIN